MNRTIVWNLVIFISMGVVSCRSTMAVIPARDTETSIMMDKHEVTISEYWKCVRKGICTEPSWIPDEDEKLSRPVVGVTVVQASTYCTWREKRLPTKQEWIFAASRAGIYPWGNEEVNCAYAVVHDGVRAGCGELDAMEVGSRPLGRSSEGIHDLIGNVWEWTSSTETYLNEEGREVLEFYVVLGSSFKSPVDDVRRTPLGDQERLMTHTQSDFDIGFRCVRDLD